MSVQVEQPEPHVLWMTIDNPSALNALDPETMGEIADQWRRLRDDDDLRVAVVTGAGEKAFSVGANLQTFVPRLQTGELGPRHGQDAYMKPPLAPVSKPVIAAVNGACLGGGFELMLATDIRLSAPHASFGLPECTWGLFPAGGGTVRLVRQIGWAPAMEILLTGRPITVDRAVAIGLVNQVVPGDVLHQRALEMAVGITRNGPVAVRRVKESVLATLDLELEAAFEFESEIAEGVFLTDEAAEGLRAFAEKRRPDFG